MAANPVLKITGISKRFGAVVANDAISLELRAGEVLALLGENGAGKSTLVSILFGHYAADAGSIEVFGRPLEPGQPKAALAAGIGMVHQHFTLADNLTVLDNVMLGTESLWQPFSRRGAAREALLAASREFGLAVHPDAVVGALSVGERQRVEILKALYRGARILILDEPTAVLTPQESESLFATLARMVAAGLSIVFISHKLDEVLRVSHRVAVLRAGRLVLDRPTPGVSKADLADAMVGRTVVPAARRAPARDTPEGLAPPCRLELRGGTLRGHGARPLLDGVELELRAGEIVAVAGVAGNGQQALADVLCGLQALDAGALTLDGSPLPARPAAFVAAGIARIPEDRHEVGVVGDLPLWENAVLERVSSPAFSRRGLLRRAAARAHARLIVQRFDVRGTEGSGTETVTRGLSGGNMQKLIVGRALTVPEGANGADGASAGPPSVIIANQPTWGLDVGAVAFVHQQLLDACAAGSALLLISEDLDEIFALADRIAVMHHGRLTEARETRHWSLASIGLAMAGGEEAGAGTAPGMPAGEMGSAA